MKLKTHHLLMFGFWMLCSLWVHFIWHLLEKKYLFPTCLEWVLLVIFSVVMSYATFKIANTSKEP